MEDLSPIAEPCRLPLRIPNEAALQDHRFLGQPVLPAVYALECLAQSVRSHFPETSLATAADCRFDKFLLLPARDRSVVAAMAELTPYKADRVEAVLLTRHVAPHSGMTRLKVHARAIFGGAVDTDAAVHAPPLKEAVAAVECRIAPERLYAELVPFGPAFQNVVTSVRLTPEGATAVVSGGPAAAWGNGLHLGSPFPLDAAFHVACVWAQRFAGIVAFPVALQKRAILQKTRSDRHYQARIRFGRREGARLLFDLWLVDQEERCCEVIRGLVMRDVSGGRLQPPEWLRAAVTD